jgi:hypothetical protein
LQNSAYKLTEIITQHGLTISVEKTKLMALKGQVPVQGKIVMDNKIIEQVNSCNYKYLGNLISYEKEVGVDNKLNNYLKITVIVSICLGYRKL